MPFHGNNITVINMSLMCTLTPFLKGYSVVDIELALHLIVYAVPRPRLAITFQENVLTKDVGSTKL